MPLTIHHVDAFADRPFAGNPAAVCVLDAPAEPRWMQLVAREMNLSETAFLVGRPDGGFDLRWYTPAVEVPLCGHATLASAHVLWETGLLSPDAPATFHTASGVLTAENGADGWIEMDFPALPVEPALVPDGLAEAIGAEVVAFAAGTTSDWLLAELASPAAVRALRPDLAGIRRLPGGCLTVTARGDAGGTHDFVSRFFGPGVGIDEDPVTGSAHCVLGPYWQGRLGKDDLLAFQASARGGVVRVRPVGPRVRLAGQAVTVLRCHSETL